MGIPVKLEAFEGPLDLLLHLIEKNKIDIYDIPIVEITEQYMEYIRQMQEENLNIMSEFMVMAATLLDIKCKMLLPKEVTEEGEEKDPREELVQQLLEYKMYKYMSYELRDRMADASRCVYRAESMPKEVLEYRLPVDIQELIGDLTLAKLQNIFNSIIKRQENKVDPIRSKFGKIEKEEVSLEDKMSDLELYARTHRYFSFRGLLEKQSSKIQVIVTFLAILDGTEHDLYQRGNHGIDDRIHVNSCKWYCRTYNGMICRCNEFFRENCRRNLHRLTGCFK